MQPRCYRHPDREATILCQRCSKPICVECMVEAAVGFQCPSCVSSGHRETRQHRVNPGGFIPRGPQAATVSLIGANVVTYVVVLLSGGLSGTLGRYLALAPQGVCGSADGAFLFRNMTYDACITRPGLVWYPGVSSGAVWQVLTSAFLHSGVIHLGFNMMALWFLGPQLEMAVGKAKFLTLYFTSALVASVFVVWLSNPFSTTVGASGAIFGLLGTFLVLTIKQGSDYRPFLIWLGLNVAFTFTSSGISWQGHLGGFVGGAAVAAIWAYLPRKRHFAAETILICVAVAAIVVKAFAVDL